MGWPQIAIHQHAAGNHEEAAEQDHERDVVAPAIDQRMRGIRGVSTRTGTLSTSDKASLRMFDSQK